MPQTSVVRRLPVGAEVQPDGGVHFRVWAPGRKRLTLVIESDPRRNDSNRAVPLEREDVGYFAVLVESASAGSRYRYRTDDDPNPYPDPASRFQPEGVHGPSQVVDPGTYKWRDDSWQGITLPGQVMYELHIGTFTPQGTWAAAAERLASLVEIGITVVEVMPVADFDGRFGWGYDGVDMFAPTRLYGTPDDFRRFVDHAHSLGLGVILDVVYNHFGPMGNYVGKFTDSYFSTTHGTDWGQAINFDGENCLGVREFFVANASYWVDEFHIDGLRLDAVQAIRDDSPEHILAAIARQVRSSARGRGTIVVAENEFQESRLVESPEVGGYGLDAAWNDDFHHAARVAMTGHNEYYYGDYQGTPQELISSITRGYLYQGQWNVRQQKFRGTPAWQLPAASFVVFTQNHDQVANSAHGLPAHALTSPGRSRAMTALLLLAPGTPLLFQGQEFASSKPFLFFADFEVSLAELVRKGRHEFLRQFRSLAGAQSHPELPDPCNLTTFDRCKLDWSQRETHVEAVALHKDLLAMRRKDPVFAGQRADRVHGAVLAAEAFLLRWLDDDGDDRLLLVNLGRDLAFRPPAEPLLAPPSGRDWQLLWSSENTKYGGSGTAQLDIRDWYLPGHAAVLLRAVSMP
ncbi:MAG TPA: malto-oligosyltrehalose trehalohydrolase [Pirellulales bacterium]|jgi:maltooligosyltrehalose trehalohydrolase|nr:malto-oligosyltrehalose trehalohydrolase [Pirellulales bacterium]